MLNITKVALYDANYREEEFLGVSEDGIFNILNYLKCQESDLTLIYSTNFHEDEIWNNEIFEDYGKFEDMTEVTSIQGRGIAYFGKGELTVNNNVIPAILTCDASPYAFFVNKNDIIGVEELK